MNNQQTDRDLGKEAIRKAAAAAKEHISDATEASEETLKNVGQKVSQGYNYAAREFKKVGGQLEQTIKDNPLLSMGVALGVGWVCGRVLTARSHHERSDRHERV